MRIARMATGREKIVSFSGGFHGRTADAISRDFPRQISRDRQTERAAAMFRQNLATSRAFERRRRAKPRR